MSCGSSGTHPAGFVTHGRLQSRKGKIGVGAPEHRPRKGKPFGVAAAGGALDFRPARIGQPEHFCDLVEGLAHGVVNGGAETYIFADADHRDDLGVAAGGEKQAVGERQRAGQPRRQRVRLQMVDRDQRRIVHHRDRFGRGETDDHAADQAGTGGGGDRRKLRKADAGFLHRAVDDAVEHVDMGARRDLRHHAAEPGVLLGLRADDVGQNAPGAVALALDHGGCGFIAGGLDAQHQHACVVIQFEPLRYRQNRRFCPSPVALWGRKVQLPVDVKTFPAGA